MCQVVSVSFNRGKWGQSGSVQPVLVPSLTRTEGLWGSGLLGRGVSEGGPAVSLSVLTSMRLLIELITHTDRHTLTLLSVMDTAGVCSGYDFTVFVEFIH